MQFLSEAEAARWLSTQGFAIGTPPHHAELERYGPHAWRFDIPLDAGRRVALARLLWESLAEEADAVLLWITDWSVWPSGEHLPLAETLRRALGAEHSLSDAPGHLFTRGEDADGLSVLTVGILFLWDVYLFRAGGQVAAFISHDEYGLVLSRNADAALPIHRRLAAFGATAA